MAAAGQMAVAGPVQLWLDVARPIQPRPPRERRGMVRPARDGEAAASPQMEFQMAARAPVQPEGACNVRAARAPGPAPAPLPDAPAVAERICFVTWLLGQTKCNGAIGELAKAARADRLFPRVGSADDVRARFDQAGADGDAHAALDDAERAYHRAA